MWRDLKILIGTFPVRTRWGLLAVLAAQVITSLLDLLGLGVVLPLMQVVMGADLGSGYLATLHGLLGSPERSTFAIILALLMVASFLAKTLISLVLQWLSLGIVARMNVRTATNILASFLAEDYLVHRGRRFADLLRVVGISVGMALTNVLGGFISLIGHALSLVLIVGFLLVMTPVPALVAIVYFGVSVFLLQRLLSGPNRRAGEVANDANWKSSHAIHDSMSGFREIRMHDAARFFLGRYRRFAGLGADAGRRANFFGQLPRQILEFITIAGLAVMLIAISANAADTSSVMPMLALFVAAAIRLMPVIVALTATLGSIAYGREGLRLTAEVLVEQGLDALGSDETARSNGSAEPMAAATLALEDVSFQYPDGVRPVVEGVSLEVPPGSSLALCGLSGSGKTTLVDIVLGLIPPTSGAVTYAGVPVDELGTAWREHVAYVPQDVFVMDAPLRENIAFGVEPSQIDDARVEEVVRRAQLEDVVADLPLGLHTLIGERGQRLSGGQRQRIGIARALYRQPSVIVFDEATSALDNATEAKITHTIGSLRGEVTTIIVAHRLSTVRDVDQLAFLDKGELAAVGSFEEVQQESELFAELVELGRLDRRD